MRAGDLDRKIVIQTVTESRSGSGAVTDSWSAFATVWAKVRPLSGREYLAAAQINAEVDTEFTIRWLSGVTPKMRISYDGNIYDIEHIAEIGRREGLKILTRIHQA